MQPEADNERITLRTIRRWATEGEPFAMLTCYDATTAKWLWRGGLRCILVGDTAAQMVFGHDSTLPAKMSLMVELTAAVRRGAPGAMIMADMPFGSYQCGDDQAVRNAMQFLTDGMADCVKLEVDEAFAPLVQRLSDSGVPVVAHIGSRPQQSRHEGGHRSAGRTAAEADRIVQTARAMLEHGAQMLLVEAVPAEVSQRIVEIAQAWPDGVRPVIGCGAGNAPHGHVVVLHDVMGLTDWHAPFAAPMVALGEQISDATAKWVDLIGSGDYLKHNHCYQMKD